MRRVQLIEIQDQTWFPRFLRDHVTDALQRILNLVNPYRPVVHRLRKALENSGTHRVLDLCSGAGGPWPLLYPILKRDGLLSLDICLTDKYPNAGVFEHAGISYQSEIDARQIPAELKGFRTFFTSFHHFGPAEARAILQDAVEKQTGIGIFEVPGRHAFTILLVFLVPAADFLLAAFMRPFRWSRLLWTYLIPVIPIVLWFDGIVSCLRTYSPQELRELTEGLSASGYKWDIGAETIGFLPIPITYLIGCPNPTKDNPHK